MEKLLIIDGNSIINRAFYAIRELTTADGLHTNGIYGFLNILLKTMEEEKPNFVVVAFDLKAPTFRHREYPLYKAQRKGMPEELAQQMPVLKELLTAMNVAYIEKEGFEADDLIGTVSTMCAQKGICCRILTGDKDDLQLVTDCTQVLLTTTSKGKTETVLYDRQQVLERYGVAPEMLIDVKGLMGDASDNIPGVAGVGEKTALTLISKYKNIEGVYENLDLMKGALHEKLVSGRESAFLSRRLATIDCAVPIGERLEDFTASEPGQALLPLLERLEFRQFAKRFRNEEKPHETETLQAGLDDIISPPNPFYYVLKDGMVLFKKGGKVFWAELLSMSSVFTNPQIKKVTNNAKEDIVYLASQGIKYEGLTYDAAIAAYVLNPARTDFSITAIAEEALDKRVDEAGAVLIFDEIKAAQELKMREYEQDKLFYEIEMPLIQVLADMQIIGFRADEKILCELSESLGAVAKKQEEIIYGLAGEEFNINSPKQLGVILFERLGLPVIKKTKTGYSTGVDILEKLRKHHEIIGHILEYRHVAKLKSTYADGLRAVINTATGKIHSTFNQTVTATGRISSTEPNLQNIPVRTELGREFRRVFIAESDDYILVDADYSQIELRVLAAIADDKSMKEAFAEGTDIHTRTAAQIFGVEAFMITDDMRRKAKAVNFGIVYGIGEFSLAEDIGVSRKEAKLYIERYLEAFCGVRDYMKETVEFARANGFVKTLSGRRRYIPEIHSQNFNLRSFGERVALNAPIQGTAADIIKIAMIRVSDALESEAPRSRLILQVHDELIVQAHRDEKEAVERLVRREMENAFELSVPLTVDMASGRSWYDAK